MTLEIFFEYMKQVTVISMANSRNKMRCKDKQQFDCLPNSTNAYHLIPYNF